jgi:iron complex outermembrane receptor protein
VHRYHLLASATLLSALSTGVTYAQVSGTIPGAQTGQIDEIVVTAQKRSESIQDVPLSIRAVTGLSLENAGVENPIGLGKVVQTLQITNTLFGSGVTIHCAGTGGRHEDQQSRNGRHRVQRVLGRPSEVWRARCRQVLTPMSPDDPSSLLFATRMIGPAHVRLSHKPTSDRTYI